MNIEDIAANAYDESVAKDEAEATPEVTPEVTEESEAKPEDGQPVDDASDITVKDETTEEAPADDEVEPDEVTDEEIAEQVDAAKTNVEALPPINRYIYDGLPQITTIGVIDGKDVTINVKTADEIPENFEWKTKRAEKLFDQALIDQGGRAMRLENKYQNEQTTRLNQQETNEIQADLAAMQAEGLIPKFSMETAINNPDNAGVKIANDVLALFQKTNMKYAQEGRSYRISYRDAYDKYEAQQARSTKGTVKPDPTIKERKQVAAKVGSGGTKEEPKYKVHAGMTVDDILREHEDDF
jgi:hypothetical protein